MLNIILFIYTLHTQMNPRLFSGHCNKCRMLDRYFLKVHKGEEELTKFLLEYSHSLTKFLTLTSTHIKFSSSDTVRDKSSFESFTENLSRHNLSHLKPSLIRISHIRDRPLVIQSICLLQSHLALILDSSRCLWWISSYSWATASNSRNFYPEHALSTAFAWTM